MNFGLVPALKKEPQVCSWCSENMERLFHIFRGRDSKQLYCCTDHLKKGEHQAALRKSSRAWDVVS